ncbi:somatostatin receptor type 2-like [Ptychodera flava]|uniref:somatostatin receptor type 2-like n=1 Tax=Ptychodera flava TaxID=63121 RepID=UPI00396A2431
MFFAVMSLMNITVSNTTDLYDDAENTTLWRSPFDLVQMKEIVAVVLSCLCLLGLTANAVVIYVLVAHIKLRTIPNIIILNLAVSDALYMLCLPFVAYQYATGSWIFGLATCKVVSSVDVINQYTGIYLLMLMSADRYLAIVKWSYAARVRTLTYAKVACLLVWAFSAVISLPNWIYSTLLPLPSGSSICSVVFPNPETDDVIYIMCMICGGFLLPLLTIILCYVRILKEILTNQMSKDDNMSTGLRKQKSRKITRLLTVCVAVFILCWLPYYSVLVVLTTSSASPTFELMVFFYTSLCLTYLNSCVNPFVYSLAGENFRQGFGKAFRRGTIGTRFTMNTMTSTPKTLRRKDSVKGVDNAAMDKAVGTPKIPHNGINLEGHQTTATSSLAKIEDARI